MGMHADAGLHEIPVVVVVVVVALLALLPQLRLLAVFFLGLGAGM